MASTAELKVLAEVQQSIKEFQKFQKTTEKSFRTLASEAKRTNQSTLSIDKTLKTLAVSAAALGTAFLGAFAGRKLIGAIEEVTKAASVQEDAIKALNTSLKLTGQLSTSTSNELQSFASALQQQTKFGDEAILSATALIQNLGRLDKEALKGATRAALDLSTALNIDLKSAALLVGKAASGEVSSFSRYGLIIEKGADASETFATALNKINESFGGAAQEQVRTFSGALQQAQNSFGDLLEEIGFIITKNPAVIATINKLSKTFADAGSAVKENQRAVSSFVTDGILFIVRSVPLVVQSIELLNTSLTAIADTFEFLTENAIVDFVKTLAIATASRTTTFTKAREQILEQRKQTEELRRQEDEQAKARAESLAALSDLSQNIVDSLTKEIEAKRNQTDAFIKDTERQIDATEELRKTISNVASAAVGVDVSAEGVGGALAGAGGRAAGGEAGAIALFVEGATKALELAIGPVAQQLKPLIDALARGPEQVDKQIGSFIRALPQIVSNVLLATGQLVQTTLEALPGLVRGLVVGVVQSAAQLFVQLQSEIPALIAEIVLQLLADLPDIINLVLTEITNSQDALAERIAETAPVIAEAFAAAAPVLIAELIASLPVVAISFATELLANMPRIVLGFAQAFAQAVPSIASKFANDFILQIPRIAAAMARSIVDQLESAFREFTGPIGKTVLGDDSGGVVDTAKGAVDSVKNFFDNLLGFQTGGEIPNVPKFQGDGALIRASAGENVVDQGTNDRLRSFLDRAERGGFGGNRQTIIEVDGQQFAAIMRDVNERGFNTGS